MGGKTSKELEDELIIRTIVEKFKMRLETFHDQYRIKNESEQINKNIKRIDYAKYLKICYDELQLDILKARVTDTILRQKIDKKNFGLTVTITKPNIFIKERINYSPYYSKDETLTCNDINAPVELLQHIQFR